MALKTILDALDDVPEALHSFYKETEGKFILDAEGIDDHPTVKTLKNAYERVKADKQKLSTDFATLRSQVPEDFDPEEYARLKDAGPGKVDEKLTQQRTALETKFAKDLKAKDDKIAELTGLIHRDKVDAGLTTALVEASVDKAYLPAVKALLRDRVKLGEDYTAVAETEYGPEPLAEYVKKWAAGDEGKAFVAKPAGGGATGGNGQTSPAANPFDKKTGNLSAQMQIIKQDRAKAERLMKAAGWGTAEIQGYLS